MTLHEQILKDKNGNNIGVFLPMADYEALLKTIRDLEDFQDVKDFDLVKSSDEEIIPIEQAFIEIEAQRNDL
ncbi:MAG: hypothetical protein IH598_05850 [Bacteroidales bacterium]|nr:hypothetical protein [Bacteroidales bacterium]